MRSSATTRVGVRARVCALTVIAARAALLALVLSPAAAQAATPGYGAAGEALQATERAASEARASVVPEARTTPESAAAARVPSVAEGAVAHVAPAQS